ncbi:coproporphyrinogen III oxidase [Mesobacillus boroniphilus JCM 21738]|uniref:Coproporphyrinogen III oxidase n=1 Tax=Mesobacillus boroniphilus JCM 21738 TaxID=1294265 RepID=W4RR33_9BACI|nr:coproporphyrinogen III oxidase [Mesobacillus boroniphilus JCM 21738]
MIFLKKINRPSMLLNRTTAKTGSFYTVLTCESNFYYTYWSMFKLKKVNLMRININGIQEDRFQRPLGLIANLFFEESEVAIGDTEHNADAAIDFEVKVVDGEISVKATLVEEDGKVFTAEADKEIPAGLSDKEEFKLLKTVISRVYLKVLQDWTGMIQKWGILTGVRPTKLLHKKLREGMKQDEAHKELKEQYLISDEKIQLMQQIVDRQLAVLPDLYDLKNGVSIYIGIPFCPTKCAYCTFPLMPSTDDRGRWILSLAGYITKSAKSGNGLKRMISRLQRFTMEAAHRHRLPLKKWICYMKRFSSHSRMLRISGK